MTGLERVGEGRWRSASEAATRRFGELLGALLEEGDVVILEGELGAGKTQLAKGVACALGAKGEVTSPTFNLLVSHLGGRIPLHHLDLYRLDPSSDSEELGEAGAWDVVGEDGASLVEWGAPFAEQLCPERLEISLVREDVAPSLAGGLDVEPARTIDVCGVGARGEALARALDATRTPS